MASQSSYSYNGTFFALLSIDNRLRVWDVTTGKLLREYSSTSNVESTCTCLTWTREKSKDTAKRRKEKNKIDRMSNILIGHGNGGISLYDTASDKHQQTFIGHSESVNCLSQNSSNKYFYSCSKDKHIVEWDMNSTEYISKWKADKNPIKMIAICPSGKNLLSAAMSIKLWDLESKIQLMKFDGHASPVTLLQFSGYRIPGKQSQNEDDGCYFLSASAEERQISSWQINQSKPDRSTTATFLTSEIPVFVHSIVQGGDKPLAIAAGCQNGTIQYYSLQMNGKVLRPIESLKKLSVVTADNKGNHPANLFNGQLQTENKELTMNFVSGSTLIPDFNKFNFTKGDAEDIVTQNAEVNMFMKKNSSRVQDPIQPAQIGGKQHVIGKTYIPAKLDLNDNVREEQITNNLTMFARLKNQEVVKPDLDTNSASISVLVRQGLHTKDMNMLGSVMLKEYPKSVIENTLKRMSTNEVVEFLNLIVDKIHGTPTTTELANMMAWTKNILSIHLSSLLLMPNIEEITGKLFNLLKSQQEYFPTLFRLQGKLDLVISQITLSDEDIKNKKAQDEDLFNPCVVFHDDSEDEDVKGDSEDSEGGENESAEDSSDEEEEMVVEKQGKGGTDDGSSDSGTY